MEIKIECPRCQTFMTLSADKAGQYAACENCGGKVWVPKQTARPKQAATEQRTATHVSQPGSATQPAATAKQSPAGATAVAGQTAQPVKTEQSVKTAQQEITQPKTPTQPTKSRSVKSQPVQPPAAPGEAARSKSTQQPVPTVAKFITADVAQSSLAVADDGKLPELRLEREEGKKKRDSGEKQGTRPWLLAVVVCVSLSMSALVLWTPSPNSQTGNARLDEARQQLIKYYGDAGDDVRTLKKLKPYQKLLRQARLAQSRGDVKTEEASYRRVLALLRDESFLRPGTPAYQKGLTGTRLSSDQADSQLLSDEDLQTQIAIILQHLD